MPEGVEVRLFTDEIRHKFNGCQMNNVQILSGKYSRQVKLKGYDKFVKSLPLKVISINNKGKFCWFQFEKGWSMWVTFGLTGKFLYEYENHCHIKFNMGKCGIFYFKDMRNFGTIHFCNSDEELEKKLNSLGIDPLIQKVKGSYLMDKVSKMRSNQEIGKVMIDKQSFVAGIGNYLRAEILYEARISPFRKVKSLTKEEWDKIAELCNRIFKNIYDLQKRKGLYTYKFKVYRKKFDPKGREVRADKLGAGNRTIWWVPKVQK